MVREQLCVTRAYANGRVNIKVELVARGRGKGRSLGVVESPARQVAKGLSIKIRKKGGRTLIRNAFIATMPSGHRGVFVRRGEARLKIDEVYTIDLLQMFNARRIKKKVLASWSRSSQKYSSARQPSISAASRADDGASFFGRTIFDNFCCHPLNVQ